MVKVDVVVGLARDDQRRARLVDQDRVDLVDDRVVQAALDALRQLEHHVVAQVIEAEFVVGAVRDVGRVRRLLGRVVHLRQIDADRQAQEAIDPPHPVRVALREIVVDGDEVDAGAGQRIEIDRQRRDERLALARAHFGDLAVVQRHAADQLHVEMAHLQHALAGFAHDGECLGQQRVECFPVGAARLELRGLGLQRRVGQRGGRGLQRVDLPDDRAVLLQQPLVAAAEDAGEDVDHEAFTCRRGRKKQGVRTASPLIPSAFAGALVAGSQLGARRNRAGFCGTPFSRTSKCRCGPVERPVEPTAATFWPRTTRSPSST